MPPITVFAAFTRLEMMDRWFEDLFSTDLDPRNTNLAFIVDCNEEEGGMKIYAKIMDEMNKVQFRKFLITRNLEHHVNSVNIPIRRKRIAEIKQQSKELIANLDGDYVLSLEDDTVFTNLCVKRLYSLASQPYVGMVTTYEAGRWTNKIIGVWNFNNVRNPTECWTELPNEDFEECDAAGFFCYLTRTELYLKHDYTTELSEPWGPDVNYGLWLRRNDYVNYVDWSQPCGHNTGSGIISPNSNLYTEHFYKTGENEWVRRKQ